MAQIFVSHSSIDNDLAFAVRACLSRLGYESVFLDIDPGDGLIPGAAWRDQLFSNLDSSDAIVLVGTPTANASLWCHSELALGRWLRKPILALLFDGSDPHELTADIQGVVLSSAELTPERILPGLAALGLDRVGRWDASRSPYPGLRAFDESFAPVFYGRERQLDRLRQLVDPPSRSRQGVIVPVLGPSGSGKSSLVRAGLVSALRPSPDWVVTEPWTPSDVPMAELALALAHAAKVHDVDVDADACSGLLGTPGGMADYHRRLRAAGTVGAGSRVLVVIDQAEELVTLTSDAERRTFLEALTRGCAAPSPLRIVMTARTDMWDGVAAEMAGFAIPVTPAVLHVPPLSRSDLARVIVEPARRSHLTLDDGLLQRLVEDTGSGDALPLLAFTLARMTADGSGPQLTNALYDRLGGVQGAIATRAAEAVHGQRTEAEVAAAILHLVGVREGRPTTRVARVEAVAPDQREILDDLVDSRLVVVRESGVHRVYAPAHEALFTAWPPLAEMIDRRREDLILRARLERRTADWLDAGSGNSGLLSDAELAKAQDWTARNPDLRTAELRAYVQASTRRARRARLVRLGVAAVVATLCLALVGVLVVSAREARRQAEVARTGQLAAIAERELVHDPVAAAVAVLEGLRLDPTSRVLRAQAERLLTSPARDVLALPDSSAPLLTVSVGERLAITTSSSEPAVWDTTTGALRARLPIASAAAAIRTDDRIAVIATPEGAQAWDLEPAEPTLLSTFGATPALIGFSPGGSLLATASGPVLDLWDLSDPANPISVATWRVPGNTVTAIRVLADGRVLASGEAATLMQWDPLGSGDLTLLVDASASAGEPTQQIDVDEGGTRVLLSSSSLAGTSVYDVTTGEQVGTFAAAEPEPAPAVPVVTFSATMDRNGALAATFDLAGRGYVFDIASADLVTTLVGGHTAPVNRASFAPSGLLLTAGLEGQLRIWDVTVGAAPTGADAPAALCTVFANRIDEPSWRLAMGEAAFDSPCGAAQQTSSDGPLPLTPQDRTTPSALQQPRTPALSESFDGGISAFATGGGAVGTGTYDRAVTGGRYRVHVENVGDGFHFWEPVPVAIAAANYSMTALVSNRSGSGGCGLTFADAMTRITVTLDSTSGAGLVTWFVDGQPMGQLSFAATPAPDAELSVVTDRANVEVRVNGVVVRRFRDDSIGQPVDAGLVTVGDTTTCDFDDFVVRTK